MTEMLTKEKFEERFQLNANAAIGCASRMDAVVGTLQQLASDAWDHAERLQAKLDAARQQMESDAETAAFAREILLREIRSLKEERGRLQSRVTLLEGQRSKPGLIGRLLKGRQP